MTQDELLAMDLDGGDDDWTPTPHGRHMAETLARRNVVEGRDILELGGGVGNHTILLIRQGVRSLVTTEISQSRSDTTRRNVERNCGPQEHVDYRVANWLNVEGDFDGIVCNPPFARSGRRNRRWFIDDLILNASSLLREGGTLTFVQ
ncbi:MAG: methyltransferase, partial [Planctomycetota bacterium]